METTHGLWEACASAVSPSPFTKYFLVFRWTLLCLRLCPLPLVRLRGNAENILAFFSLHLPFRYLYTHKITVWTFSSPSWRVLAFSALPHRCSSLCIILVTHCWTCSSSFLSLLCWEAQNWTQHFRCGLTRSWLRQKDYLPNLLANQGYHIP